MQRNIQKLGEALVPVVEDYEDDREPFADAKGITTPITDEIDGDRETALFLTLSTALNRQRDAESLYRKCERLWYDEHWIYEPEELVEARNFRELASLFEAENMRYGEDDAEVWYEIARTFHREFDDSPMALFAEHDFDWQRIASYVRSASGDARFFVGGMKFPVLRGEKVRPVWLRLINNQVVDLARAEQGTVPVDTHVIQITESLSGASLSSSEADKHRIRRFWRAVCDGSPVEPVDVDGPLWYMNRGWESWGRDYLCDHLYDVGLELGEVAMPA